MRVKIVKDHEPYFAGQIIYLPTKEAKLLIKSGIAINTKDMDRLDLKET